MLKRIKVSCSSFLLLQLLITKITNLRTFTILKTFSYAMLNKIGQKDAYELGWGAGSQEDGIF